MFDLERFVKAQENTYDTDPLVTNELTDFNSDMGKPREE